MKHAEEYIIENADSFDWKSFQCDLNIYSKEFAEDFKHEIEVFVWKNSQQKLHRLDGPAVEYADGDKRWYLNGEYHRVDGPAREFSNGDKYWYLNGKELTKEEHSEKTQSKIHELW